MGEKSLSVHGNRYAIPVIYDIRDIDKVPSLPSDVVLLGRVLDILNIKRIVMHLKELGKTVITDIDLIRGVNTDVYAVQYLAKEIGVDGLISTHSQLLQTAKKERMITILKVFAYDEHSVSSSLKVINACQPDFLEVLPGIAAPYLMIAMKKSGMNIPVNVAGFLGQKLSDTVELLKLGVSALHTGDQKLWKIDFEELLEKIQDKSSCNCEFDVIY